MMTDEEGGMSCAQGCWGLAALSGIIAAALLMIMGDWRLIQALFALIVITIILGALLQWLVCRPLAAPGEARVDRRPANPTPTSKQSAAAAAARAREGAEPKPDTPAAAAAQAARAGVKPTKALSGEAELASRKGTWKYGAGAGSDASAPPQAAKADPTPPPAADSDPAAQPAAAPAARTVSDADAPERLGSARDGGPDDLKMIKGVGPKLEQMLHSMGFFHFDQIASWSDREVAWVDENLEGFKGRVSRDNWVGQAKTLASGGSTEFSDKSNKGDVY